MNTQYVANTLDKGLFDVVVCGGGCAGVVAAIAAARRGVKTALIEKTSALGGSAYNSLVGPFMTCYDGAGERQIIKGIFDEIVCRMEERGGAIHPSKTGKVSDHGCYNNLRHNNVTPFEPEALKFVCFEMLEEAGVELFLNYTLLDAVVEDGDVKGAVCFDGTNLAVFRGGVFVDCTGDGLLSAKAGAEFVVGRPEDGLTQAMTVFFSVYDVDDAKVAEYRESHPEARYAPYHDLVEAARARGEFHVNRNKIAMYRMVKPGQWRLNTTRIQKVDPLDPEGVTGAYAEGLKQVDFLMNFFKKVPGLENAKLMQTAVSLGIRDSRRIKGAYTLTVEDIYADKQFEDTIALCGYPVDIHLPTGHDTGAKSDENLPNDYRIPYRILVPEKIGSLLVAGRCVSASHEALGAIRVMPPVMAMGHAAGIAAALSAKEKKQPRDIEIGALQKELVAEGGIIE